MKDTQGVVTDRIQAPGISIRYRMDRAICVPVRASTNLPYFHVITFSLNPANRNWKDMSDLIHQSYVTLVS